MALRTWRGTTNANWGTATNWLQGAVPLATDDVVFDATSPACTVNVAGLGLSIDFTNYSNTITMTNTITISGNITLGSGMTFTGTSAIVAGTTGTWTSNGKSIPYLSTNNSATYTLADDWTVTSAFSILSSSTPIINGVGRKLNISGNFTHGSTIIVNGTATLNFNGTGTWTSTSTGTIRMNVTINTAGTLTIGNIIFNTGSFVYTAGTVICNGTFSLGSTTNFDTTGITWNNFTFVTANIVLTTNDINVNGLLTIGTLANTVTLTALSGTKTITTNGGLLSTLSTGNITSTSVNIKVTGGTITPGASAATQGYIAVPIFEFAGNSTMASTGFLHLYGGVSATNVVKWTSGTITTTGSNVILNNITIDTNGMTWGNLRVYQSAATTPIVLTSDLSCSGLLNLGYTSIVNTINGVGRTINTAGGFTFTAGVTSTIVTGSVKLVVTGGSVTGLSSGQLRLNMDLAGNVTFSGSMFYNTGTITYVSGTITTTGSTITSNTVLNMNTNGMTWNNISFSASGLGLTLLSNFSMSGLLTTSGSFTFLGAFDATIGGITTTIAASIITLVAGRTYNLTGAILLTGTLASPIQLRTSSAGSVAFFNSVNNGTSTRDVGFVTTTDINSSGGLTIYDYKGIITNNTTNWSVLPTDVRTLSYGYSV